MRTDLEDRNGLSAPEYRVLEERKSESSDSYELFEEEKEDEPRQANPCDESELFDFGDNQSFSAPEGSQGDASAGSSERSPKFNSAEFEDPELLGFNDIFQDNAAK